MAKTKEASTPLICAVVFFVLTTIAFGVMWYLSYSEMDTHVNNKKNAEKDLATMRASKDEAERLARVYRILAGVSRDDDVQVITTEAKPNDKIAAEVKYFNETLVKKAGSGDAAKLPKEIELWPIDANGKAGTPPPEGLIGQVGKIDKKETLYEATEKALANYQKLAQSMVDDTKQLQAAAAALKAASDKFPADVKKQVADVVAAFDKRTADYQRDMAAANKALTDAKDARDVSDRDLRRTTKQLSDLQQDNQRLAQEVNKGDRGAFSFDEPQGKVLRKLPDGVYEINLGSAANVRPGLTFTVQPRDFQEKGRESRMRSVRVPDPKGGFKSVDKFIPRGAVEVYEVLGPNLSLARFQRSADPQNSPYGAELDPVRDGIVVGDLLYNSVWRKGVADRVALVGIFDINGDGTDDIETVVRDLTKMGIPVDAYFDMKKRVWVGQVTERTRYVVEGYYPINSATDPNRDEKTKLLNTMSAAINETKQKGVSTVNFRDFFGRMGYKFRLDVGDDRINQATVPYLGNVGVGDPAPPAP
ncbi:hypothetical protein R5W24_000599 [Gemmata sp. JC717]|uniref:hypothetical protein n=1 Tax=Gemmata algarum TaxID=2975278 RepID=UPI0021BB79BD|nr:hypothetical protein [Gemmata algarum]MDY3551521.1 hypothetical protein [Gemmata algarum]